MNMPGRSVIPNRKVRRYGSEEVSRLGGTDFYWGDFYYFLHSLSWPRFIGVIALLYLLINTLFALLYLLGHDSIEHLRPGSFSDAFFYSVDILSTVGYSDLRPHTLYGKIVGLLQAFTGLLGFAIVTGLMYSRFAKPVARLVFSRVAVIVPYNGVPTLMIRVANQRRNLILEGYARLVVVQDEVTQEGEFLRRMHELKLLRHQSPMFDLTWTIMHPIVEGSPLLGATSETLAAKAAEVVVTVTGIDEVMDQPIHARGSYVGDELKWNMRFQDVLTWTEEGQVVADYAKFHEVEPQLKRTAA